jgi:hypothetical protein
MLKTTTDGYLDLETEKGWRIRDLELLNGHHLVYKLPIEDKDQVLLPDEFKKKSIKNVTMIRGLVLRVSAPFARKRTKKYWVWDSKKEDMVHKWRLHEGIKLFPPDIQEGHGILYASYNVGKIKANGITEPLVIIRDIDVLATFPISESKRVDLPSQVYR